jgi:hypothetical protein
MVFSGLTLAFENAGGLQINQLNGIATLQTTGHENKQTDKTP